MNENVKVKPAELSADELRELLAKREADEAAAAEAEAQAAVEALDGELEEATAAVAAAKETRKSLISKAKEVAQEEGDKVVDAAKEALKAVKDKIRATGGKTPSVPTKSGTRTKSKGFGDRKCKEVVLSVLGEFDGPVKGKDICERILDDGLFAGQRSSLNCSTSIALNELANEGEVVKEGNRRSATYEMA